MGIRENVRNLETSKVRRNYRMHLTFALIFFVVLIVSVFVQERLPIDAVIWLFIVIANGYAAYVTKLELDGRID